MNFDTKADELKYKLGKYLEYIKINKYFLYYIQEVRNSSNIRNHDQGNILLNFANKASELEKIDKNKTKREIIDEYIALIDIDNIDEDILDKLLLHFTYIQ